MTYQKPVLPCGMCHTGRSRGPDAADAANLICRTSQGGIEASVASWKAHPIVRRRLIPPPFAYIFADNLSLIANGLSISKGFHTRGKQLLLIRLTSTDHSLA
jgi:hypothetical protein